MKNDSKNILLIAFFLCISYYKADAQNVEVVVQEVDEDAKDPIKDIPKKIYYKYGKPMIPDKETALQYADLVLKKRFRNVPFDEFKPYIINLIADERVWEIKVQIADYANKYFLIRINKNNGEILNCWQEGR